jgi:hypothetical protein
MRTGFRTSLIGVAITSAAASAVLSLWVTGAAGQVKVPARIVGKPNLSGIWQANNEAHWDLEAHEARSGAVTQPGVYPYDFARVPAAPSLPFGAAGGVPGSIGVVQGDGKIPYTPEALKIKEQNAANWIDRDPELKCYLPGTPRGMYMPYPVQITQSTNKVHVAYSFNAASRTIHLDKVDNPPDDTWMGHSLGRWEGDTLVVDSRHFNDKTWFDRAGNFHSEALHVVERFSLLTPDVVRYEATIEDPKTFTRPWQISMPLYRRMEPGMQLLEYRCTEFVEEFLLGMLRREQLVKRWESETMVIDITRKVPEGDRFYDWYGK